MSSTLREVHQFLKEVIGNKRYWIVLGSMIVLFVLTGPFGTFERMSITTRTVYWFGVMLGTWTIAITTIAVLVGVFRQSNIHQLPIVIVGALLSSVPIALYVRTYLSLFVSAEYLPTFGEQLTYTVPISLAFGTLVYFAISENWSPGETQAGDLVPETANLLLDRLPPDKRGPVQHLAMQDHYVKVTTTRGSELVLMRMVDAVSALSDSGGVQIHRSYWVNPAFALSHKRTQGQPYVVMSDGSDFPVSRTYAKAAKEAGLI